MGKNFVGKSAVDAKLPPARRERAGQQKGFFDAIHQKILISVESGGTITNISKTNVFLRRSLTGTAWIYPQKGEITYD